MCRKPLLTALLLLLRNKRAYLFYLQKNLMCTAKRSGVFDIDFDNVL
jgi:hypothetical protein